MFNCVLNIPQSSNVNKVFFDEESISLICMTNQQKIRVFLNDIDAVSVTNGQECRVFV